METPKAAIDDWQLVPGLRWLAAKPRRQQSSGCSPSDLPPRYPVWCSLRVGQARHDAADDVDSQSVPVVRGAWPPKPAFEASVEGV